MKTELKDVRVSQCCSAPESEDRENFCSACGEGTVFELVLDEVQVNPMANYTEAQAEVTRNYKLMDKALAEAVMERLGYVVPALFTFVDIETGDKYAVNITARATLIERRKPTEAPDENV